MSSVHVLEMAMSLAVRLRLHSRATWVGVGALGRTTGFRAFPVSRRAMEIRVRVRV